MLAWQYPMGQNTAVPVLGSLLASLCTREKVGGGGGGGGGELLLLSSHHCSECHGVANIFICEYSGHIEF